VPLRLSGKFFIEFKLEGNPDMSMTSRRLAALFVIGIAALFSPLLGAFNRPAIFFGIPVLPLYLFMVWGALVLVSWLLGRGDKS
jgi:hypothetical protein